MRNDKELLSIMDEYHFTVFVFSGSTSNENYKRVYKILTDPTSKLRNQDAFKSKFDKQLEHSGFSDTLNEQFTQLVNTVEMPVDAVDGMCRFYVMHLKIINALHHENKDINNASWLKWITEFPSINKLRCKRFSKIEVNKKIERLEEQLQIERKIENKKKEIQGIIRNSLKDVKVSNKENNRKNRCFNIFQGSDCLNCIRF